MEKFIRPLIGTLAFLACCIQSLDAQQINRSGGYGFNRPTGGYGFNRPTGGYGFNRSVRPLPSGPIAVPGYRPRRIYPGLPYPVVGPNGVAYGYSAGIASSGFYGPSPYLGGSTLAFPKLNRGVPYTVQPSSQPTPPPTLRDGKLTLPGTSSTLTFPRINLGGRRRTP